MSDPTAQHAAAEAIALLQARRPAEAAEAMSRAIALEPHVAEHHYHLSLMLSATGQVDSAIDSLRRAIQLSPTLAEAHINLGVMLLNKGQPGAAEECFRTALQLGRTDEGVFRNLGKALRDQDRIDEAIEAFGTAISRAPGSSIAWMMLASALRETGQISEAVRAARKAVQLNPGYREAHSNLCYLLYFDPGAPPADLLTEHRAWAAKFAPVPARAPTRSLNQPLRIGYVSPNFRNHVIGFFMEPILRHHDRSQFAITCYSDANPEDELTARLRSTETTWRPTHGLSDAALAEAIRADEIDILVDLTLHMRGCRLGVFAAKPAPVQLTHLAYCGTSGLPQMDGCITDTHMLAPGCESYFAETLLPLPTSYWCYQPPAAAPETGPLPMVRNGYVTFGSLNTAAKVNDQVVRVWSKLLHSVPGSKLTIHAPRGSRPLPARFALHGIDPGRLNLVPRQSLAEYFQTWNQIDIGLDPFPYNGGTTTLDALWMGVPVVTLSGALPVGRAGMSILRNLKLDHLITDSEQAYLDVAKQLTDNVETLSSLRKNARANILKSPLFDAPRYVSELEAAYRLAVIRRTR